MNIEYCDKCEEPYCESCDGWEMCDRCNDVFCEDCVDEANFNSDHHCEGCYIPPERDEDTEHDEAKIAEYEKTLEAKQNGTD